MNINNLDPLDRFFTQNSGATNKGRTVKWGKDLTLETMQALKDGEVITVLWKTGRPYALLCRDYYGVLRQKMCENHLSLLKKAIKVIARREADIYSLDRYICHLSKTLSMNPRDIIKEIDYFIESKHVS
jgi:hypothetical protein